MGKVFIGTSGFSYSHWKAVFYPKELPQSEWLRYYAKYFDTVELNVSFYRLPNKKTFTGWREKVGRDFVFAVKGSRFISHVKRLKDCQEPVKLFFKEVGGLGHSAKTVILWQLPPSLKKDTERLEKFLSLLENLPARRSLGEGGPKNGSRFRHAFEFRHKSWVDKDVFTLLQHRNKVEATAVFQDWKDWPRLTEDAEIYRKHRKLIEGFPFMYIRFHGAKILYTSGYSKKELEEWAQNLRQWIHEGRDVYAYFNNDAAGFAVPNALKLKELVGK